MSRRLFTLIELLVVIAIIAILAGIMLPALGRARVRAHEIACRSQLRQTSLVLMMYADDHNGRYPVEPTEHNPHPSLMQKLLGYNMSLDSLYCPAAPSMESRANDPNIGRPEGIADSLVDTPENREAGNISYVYWSFEDNKTTPAGVQWRNSPPFSPRALTTAGMRAVPKTPADTNLNVATAKIWVMSDWWKQAGGDHIHGRRGGRQGDGFNVAFLDGHIEIFRGRPQDNYN